MVLDNLVSATTNDHLHKRPDREEFHGKFRPLRRRAKVRQIWLLPVHALMVLCLAGSAAMTGAVQAAPAQASGPATSDRQPREVRRPSIWQPPAGLRQVPIWPAGAPDMAVNPGPGESVLTRDTPQAIGGRTSQAVFDVTSPTMTVFPPRGRNSGVAIIVFPGGGFRAVVITLEGTEICNWLTSRGITCVLLKYRVPGSNHYWNDECHCHITPAVPRALQDAQRTIRLVRQRAGELGVDPGRIGVIGFSAGGYLVAQTSNIFESTYRRVDAADDLNSRPDFAVALYPGHICRAGGTMDPGIHVTRQTPPTFLLQAWDDPVDEICNSTLYAHALAMAGVPAEVHLFAKGGHAFALRRTVHPIAVWPSLVENWLHGLGLL
jgi:acetyl esterase/lipase